MRNLNGYEKTKIKRKCTLDQQVCIILRIKTPFSGINIQDNSCTATWVMSSLKEEEGRIAATPVPTSSNSELKEEEAWWNALLLLPKRPISYDFGFDDNEDD